MKESDRVLAKTHAKRRAAAFILLSAAATAFIFFNSLQSGEDSSQASGFFADVLKKLAGAFGLEPSPGSLSHFVRKLAHFSEYFVLAAFVFGAAAAKTPPGGAAAISVLYPCAVAFADEFIMQRMTVGRSPQITDVFIDVSGAATAAAALYIITVLTRAGKRR